jgi:hypothetical protein
LAAMAQTDAVPEPALRKELIELVDIDQKARNTLIDWMKTHSVAGKDGISKLPPDQKVEFEKLTETMNKIDQSNTERLKAIVEQHGWPRVSRIGKDGANAAWLLVQHADADIPFQKKCLKMMNELPKEEYSAGNFAYLTDRVLLAEGKKQLFGTQFSITEGKLMARPIEDEANVDKRRKEVGLSTMAEYTKLIEKQYAPPKK